MLVAADKFKGSLTAVQVAERVTAGLRRVVPDLEVTAMPVADGGDGTVDAAVAAGFERRETRVAGPLGDEVAAAFAVRGDTAVVEMAEASGLQRLPKGVFAPLTSSTYGSGELLRAALDAGARTIVFGVGGSATTDGGAGMLSALGARFLDAEGEPVPRAAAASPTSPRPTSPAWTPASPPSTSSSRATSTTPSQDPRAPPRSTAPRRVPHRTTWTPSTRPSGTT